jgi:hypothetical protein
LLGVSVWVEILLDKFASYRPTERLLARWRLLGLDVAAGTVAGGLERLEPLLQPLQAGSHRRFTWVPLAPSRRRRPFRVMIARSGQSVRRAPGRGRFLGEGEVDTIMKRLVNARRLMAVSVPLALVLVVWLGRPAVPLLFAREAPLHSHPLPESLQQSPSEGERTCSMLLGNTRIVHPDPFWPRYWRALAGRPWPGDYRCPFVPPGTEISTGSGAKSS